MKERFRVAFYMGKAGASHVASLLEQVMNNKAEGYMNVINLTEIVSTIFHQCQIFGMILL